MDICDFKAENAILTTRVQVQGTVQKIPYKKRARRQQ